MTLIVQVRVVGLGPKQPQLITMHAQLGLRDKGRVIKGLVVYYCMMLMIYGMGLWSSARSGWLSSSSTTATPHMLLMLSKTFLLIIDHMIEICKFPPQSR